MHYNMMNLKNTQSERSQSQKTSYYDLHLSGVRKATEIESRLVATRDWGRGNEKLKSVSFKLWAGLNGAIFPWGQDPCLLHMETQGNKRNISKKSLTLDLNNEAQSSSTSAQPPHPPTGQSSSQKPLQSTSASKMMRLPKYGFLTNSDSCKSEKLSRQAWLFI